MYCFHFTIFFTIHFSYENGSIHKVLPVVFILILKMSKRMTMALFKSIIQSFSESNLRLTYNHHILFLFYQSSPMASLV